ncbi:zinc ribbon domain-containing protein [Nocardioides terrisoli]|uniref:zinc ribbon domain-containing protein n=1 Tax=Nocardioides terrisoli TaxID=3388267 RepID=UPI00287B89AA|nr:zinc ribbon domain-containing protein [Nocardioides marmorisolisilvae]
MSDVPGPGPGLVHQRGVRNTLRLVGAVLLVVSVVFFIMGLVDFFAAMSPSSLDSTPHRFWMLFVGVILFAPAAWCLQAGFFGAAARFAMGEAAPVVKQSAGYLTDGTGVLGIGAEQRTCAQCGVENDGAAKFCDSCGAALG